MITEYQVTLAAAADARDISELSRDAVEHGLSWRWTERRVLRGIADASVNVVVVRQAPRLLGFAIMSYGEEDAHIALLAVRADQRRSGLGSALLSWLELTCRVAGIRRIRLEARSGNGAARAFYLRHGFGESGQRPGYYENIEDAVLLVKDLRPDAAD